MEKYVVSLEQAKRLYELEASSKFDIISENVWVETVDDTGKKHHFLNFIPWEHVVKAPAAYYPAYHVGELGEMLGAWCENIQTDLPGVWNLFFARLPHGVESYPTEAQARGALLQYLLEHRLL